MYVEEEWTARSAGHVKDEICVLCMFFFLIFDCLFCDILRIYFHFFTFNLSVDIILLILEM